MLTSLEVMQSANISRATLNNYISLGLLPRPLVKNPEPGDSTTARQIGYFPEEILARLDRISELKKEGYAMSDIPGQLELEGFPSPEKIAEEMSAEEITPEISTPISEQSVQSKSSGSKNLPTVMSLKSNLLRLTIDHIPYPAYMVNYNFEITWFNEEARSDLLGSFDQLPADIKDRNALSYLLKGKLGRNGANHEELLQFYLLLGKGRYSRNDLMNILTGQADVSRINKDETLAEFRPNGTLMQLPLSLCMENGEIAHYNVYASYYREGILFIHLPSHADSDSLLGLLERRDEVIRNLLKKHLPVLTDVAVLVTDLQSSVRICTELPPEEYFELINQIWAEMEPIFRKYYGTHGKHVGDGMVYYFFPQPDCNYIFNALMCAQEMKSTMRKISKQWQLRKNWMNELYLNTGLNEGHEWLGIFHIETKVEFTVLGDTINHAARLSDFARGGAIWATKSLLGKLPASDRQRVKFGIRRKDADGREVFVNTFYSRVSELAYLNDAGRNEKLNDISALPVTEIIEVGA
jgi:adenylate cyclase